MREGGKRAVTRRRLLAALALAPAAAVGCAGGRAERRTRGEPAPGPEHDRSSRGGGAAAPGPVVAAIRAFPVAADAEPAFVFRAAAGRPGGPR